MSLVLKDRAGPTARLASLALASGVPMACYLATASAHDYWLDGGEFVAASTDLGIAHPPGHPLAALIGHALTLIPLGPIPLRVALASALMAAVAAGALFCAIETTVRSLGPFPDRVTVPLSLGATWLVAGSFGWWLQAVRPEVYALEAAVVLVVIERVLIVEASWPTSDVRPIYVAGLALGLGLANHHFLALLVLPAIAPTLARLLRARGRRPLWIFAAAVAAGLCTYVYLPLRAAADPPVNLGAPTTLGRLWWVISAQAFQKNAGEGVPQSLGERFADVGVQLVENLHWLPILLALAGLYALVRTPGARRIGYVWGVLLVFTIAARAWLGFVRSNPDALGYLMGAFAAVGALSAAFLAAALRALGAAGATKSTRPRRTAVAIALVAAALGAAQIHRSAAAASLARFTATEPFDDLRHRDLPPRAVVLAHGPQTIFRHWGVEASERVRPDITLVPIPFVTYPGMPASLRARDPDITDVLLGHLLEGELRQPDLQSLAAERPLFVELDPRVPQALYETIVPSGLLSEVLADGATDADERAGAVAQKQAYARLYARLGPERREPLTAPQLLWAHYMDALYYAGVGDRDSARESVRLGLGVQPMARELRALDAALARAQPGTPLDISLFLPFATDSP